MRVTIVRENFGDLVVVDMPEVPQVGDCINLPEFNAYTEKIGGVWTIFRRMWFPKEQMVKVYVKEK